MKSVERISCAELKTLLHYNPEAGVFTRLVRTSNRIKVGDVAGGLNAGGYVQIRIHGVLQQAHRLAWLYMTGQWPEHEIDHRNTIPSDNRWENLRETPHKMNSENQRRAHTNNRSGLLGVYRRQTKFVAEVRVNGKKHFLGYFDTPEVAHAAYLDAKRKLHEGCTL